MSELILRPRGARWHWPSKTKICGRRLEFTRQISRRRRWKTKFLPNWKSSSAMNGRSESENAGWKSETESLMLEVKVEKDRLKFLNGKLIWRRPSVSP